MAFDLVSVTDGKMAVNYHSGQDLAMASEAQETYISAGLQSGKTTMLPHWMRREMQRCGPGSGEFSYLVLGPTFAVLGNKTVPTFKRIFEDLTGWAKLIQTPKLRLELTAKGEQDLFGHRQKERTNIYFGYADDPNSFAGFTSLAACADEIGQPRFRRGAHSELVGRLSIARGQVAPNNAAVNLPADLRMGRFLGGSIVYGLHWVYDFYKQWQAALAARAAQMRAGEITRAELMDELARGLVHPRFHFIQFDSTKNPAFPQEEFEAARRTMEPWFFDMRYRGIFSRPAGLIYNMWAPKFETDMARIPAHWPRAAAFDPGDVNFYGVIGANRPDSDEWIIYDTYFDAEKSMSDRGREISERYPNLEWCIVGQISEQRWRNELLRGGLRAEAPPKRDFWNGINNNVAAIRSELLYINSTAPADAGPQWLAQVERCKELVDEMGTYSRPVDDVGNPIFGKPPEDESQRHLMAALRYFGTRAFEGIMPSSEFVAGALEGGMRAARGTGASAPGAALEAAPSARGPVAGGVLSGYDLDASLGWGGDGDPFLD